MRPVFGAEEQGKGYRRASDFEFDGNGQLRLQDAGAAEVGPGDVFLHLEFEPNVVAARATYFQDLQAQGVTVLFLIYRSAAGDAPGLFYAEGAASYGRWLQVVASSDGALCISHSVAAQLRKWMSDNAPDRISVFRTGTIALGADFNAHPTTVGLPDDAANTLTAIRSHRSFLMVGTLEPRKRHDQVLDAFELLWQKGEDVALVIVGRTGWLADKMVQRLRCHPQLGKHLFWLEAISDQFLDEIYAACSCLIAASVDEGFGLPLVEAAYHGLPMIVRDIPVFRELAGEGAYYFKGAEADSLAQAIVGWLDLDSRQSAPLPDGICTRTWKDAAGDLLAALTIGNRHYLVGAGTRVDGKVSVEQALARIDDELAAYRHEKGNAKEYAMMRSAEVDYCGLRVAVLAAACRRSGQGGAERFYDGLIGGFKELGCEAEMIPLPADEPSFDVIIDNYRHCESMDLSRYDLVVSTKTPTYAVKHRAHVLYLVHTVRVFDDMFEAAFPQASVEQFVQRSSLHALDLAAMLGAKARFAIGHEVASRLFRWRGLTAEVMHPPLGVHNLRNAPSEGYLFMPGRLHPWKRVDLAIEAVRQSQLPLKLVIAGTGEAEGSLRRLAADDPRVDFLGHISDDELVEWYAKALAVVFTPLHEDYGYVTLEAFASGKPVITCCDSGEPTRLVSNGETGWVCEPNAASLRATFEASFNDPDAAAVMGARGARLVAEMPSWKTIARRLAESTRKPPPKRRLTMTVLDMQPIDPPVGGGRLRLLGLYHRLGDAFDWYLHRQLRLARRALPSA